jgi:uncharacterized protein YceK
MIRNIVLVIIIAVTAMTTAGCSTTRSTSQQASANVSTQFIYPITAEQANNVLIEAMQYQFPDSSIVRVELPYKGYLVTKRFLLDSQDFTSRMIPAKGRDDNGKIFDGFYFEVIDAGTMPISGSVRASSLFDKIIAIANNIARPLPTARLEQ